MGRVTFSVENKVQASSDFPKLRLEANARARVVCLEDPVAEYVHTLRAPKIVNGEPEMQRVQRKDGSSFEDYKMDFIGRPICLGDPDILADQGSDPKNCPVCKQASEGDTVQAPQRRFAMHVAQYNIKQGGFEVSNPFGVQIVVWAFTDRTFNKLVDFQQEWGNLQAHDLLLGPCTNVTFQTFDIGISAKAEWLVSDDRKRMTATAFKENQTNDLSSFCGRKVERRWLEDDLEKVRLRWADATGRTTASAAPRDMTAGVGEMASLDAGLDDLLSGQTGSSSAATNPSQGPGGAPDTPSSADPLSGDPTSAAGPTDATADLLADLDRTPAPQEPRAEDRSAAGAVSKPGASGETVSFDDLLQGL